MTWRALRRLFVLGLLLLLALLTPLAVLRIWTYAVVGRTLYLNAAAVPRADVVVVLASGARPGGPSAAAIPRLNAAIDLLRAERARSVLVSGQPFEVSAMRRYLVQQGVDPALIAADNGSERTLDSCDYLKTAYPSASIVLVSQAEHVARAVYTCRELGVAVVGLIAPDFGGTAFLEYRLHELFALPLAWWDLRAPQR